MRVTTLIIVIAIVAGGAYFAWKKGYLGQAQQAAEQSFDVHFSKGQTLFQGMKYDEAIQEFQKALTLQPNHPQAPDALLRMGDCYRDMKQTDKAIETYEKIIKEYPDYKARGIVEKAIEKLKGMK